ncbi:MAG: helix-turn-helix transcriptional regulator [Oscillibacter sp.]|nr:helix-turn-helix transcriptional regulator [Oscillibacter sp.]
MNNIEQLRKSHELTRADLAAKLGTTHAAIYKWERGLNLPQMETAIKMADFFEVSLDYLMGRESA